MHTRVRFKRLQIYLPEDDYEDFLEICKDVKRDISYVGRRMIQKCLREIEKEDQHMATNAIAISHLFKKRWTKPPQFRPQRSDRVS